VGSEQVSDQLLLVSNDRNHKVNDLLLGESLSSRPFELRSKQVVVGP
jgi:hypothetical protein